MIQAGGAARDLLHRLDQCLRSRPPDVRARAFWSMAARAASARPRSSSPMPSAPGSSPRPAAPRNARPASSSAPIAAIDHRREDFVAVIEEATGGQGRRCHPRHGGRRLYQAQSEDPRRRGAAGADRLSPGRQGRDRSRPAHDEAARPSPARPCGRARSPRRAPSRKSLQEKVWPLIEAGKVAPVIFKTFPLAEAAEAHRLMESSSHIGKIVLTTGRD